MKEIDGIHSYDPKNVYEKEQLKDNNLCSFIYTYY